MNRVLAIVVLVVAIAGAALFTLVAAVVLGWKLWAGMSGVSAVPPALKRPAVLFGGGKLQKSQILNDPSFGSITDIILNPSADSSLGVAGTGGAVFLDSAGAVTSRVSFAGQFSPVQFVDVTGDSVWEFLDRGGHGWSDASLLAARGKVLWTYGGMPGVDDMASGDVDGDGILDFVVGFNGNGGIRRLDRKSKLIWQQPGGNVWHVEIADTDHDGKREILHSDAGDVIAVRGADGRLLRQIRLGAYCAHFSICQWPGLNQECILLAGDDEVKLYDYAGSSMAKLRAPSSGVLGFARGTAVRLREDEPAYLAVIVDFDHWNASSLYVYGPDETLVYQEVLGHSCPSLAAVPRPESGAEDLLLGGTDTLWKYTWAN
ncbi:MAG: FG-GAP repeat domain-containing protein [Candidatus Saccharimonadales bacterium]